MKQAVLFAFSKKGIGTAESIRNTLAAEYICRLYVPEKFQDPPREIYPIKGSVGVFTGRVFDKADALIYVGACGIAIRAIAPYIKSKTTDPAVICVDELGTFCIALLSGHIGGGNRLTNKLAEKIGATPVVTTATDINQRFSVDAWAAENGFVIDSLAIAKEVSAQILEREIPIYADVEIKGKLPAGLCKKESGDLGISVSVYQKKPFDHTLTLIPKVLYLGIGCRRGTDAKVIEQAVAQVFADNQLDLRAIKGAASIELKKDEEGLLKFCEFYHLPVKFYSAEELLDVPGEFTSSGFVKGVTGVDNVCERSAAACGGNLLIKKTARNGVTVAVSQVDWTIDFDCR